MNLEVPRRAYFRFSHNCRYREEPVTIDGDIKDWSDDCKIPNLGGVEGETPFADFLMTWNDDGLYFAVSVTNKKDFKINPKNYWLGDCLELWIDT